METSKEFIAQRRITPEGGQSTGEYVLPDYLGDVKKLLYTRARAVPAGKYKNGEMLDIVGVVAYDVVYLDSEDNITPLSFTTDYDLSARINDEAFVDASVSVGIGNYSLRLMGPRKFSGKAALECECLVAERREYSVQGDAATDEATVAATKTVKVLTGAYGKGNERELAEEVAHIEGAIVDEVEVLLFDVEPRNITVAECEDGAEVKADVYFTLIIKEAGAAPHTIEYMASYSEMIRCDGLDDRMTLGADIAVLSARTEINPVEDGVSIVASVILEPEVRGVGNLPLRLLTDCYSQRAECKNEEGEFVYTEHIGSVFAGERLSIEMPREDAQLEGARNILFASASAKMLDASVIEQGVRIDATIRFSGIACEVNESGEISYSTVKLDVPFSDTVNYDLQLPDNAKARAYISVTQPKIEIDQKSVRPSCQLMIYTTVECEKNQRCVTASLLGERYSEVDQSVIKVYYPEAGESLYEVAKRHHVSPHKLASDNELSAEVFSAQDSPDGLLGIRYLVIE